VANFTALAATAKRLIDDNGRSITVIKWGSASKDTEKPWRGRRGYREAEVTGAAVFVPRTLKLSTFASDDEEGTSRLRNYCYFAADNDAGYDLSTFDAIEDGGVIWRIESVEKIEPAALRVLYQIEVVR